MNLSEFAKSFSNANSDKIGDIIEKLTDQAIQQRRQHERRWYDNNFFDDGYHFRVVSRKTGRVIDQTQKNSGGIERAIPRASRQIRGVNNLLFASEPYPVVYPDRISIEEFRLNDGSIDQAAYEQKYKQNKQVARKKGVWLSTEIEEQDLDIKLIDMLLLAAKNSIAYMQIYSDPEKQKIITKVRDAFDMIHFGYMRDLNELPFITVATPMSIDEVMSNPMFDESKLSKLSPDNRYATSEVKEAYMRARYGSRSSEKEKSTLIVKETYLNEVLSENNWSKIVKLTQNDSNVMEGKSKGDFVMRQAFSAGGVTLNDGYVDYDRYPFAEYRYEPGMLYQVPFIERFIPQNKSLDIIVTRLEKWVNAMIVGVYQKRKGENFQVSNFPGGQMIEYETTPLTQMQNSTVGNTPFAVLETLNNLIDEQGAASASTGQLPNGVKSGVAIESLKATEYANLKIPLKMLKKTVKDIAELMLERAHKDFIEPVEVESLEDGEPNYFDVIGKRGYDMSQKVKKQLPNDVVVLDKDVKVRIEIEPGLGFTMDGRRAAMKEIVDYMTQLSELGLVTKEAIDMITKRFLEQYGYGTTQELMEAMETGTNQQELDQAQIDKLKIAVLETLKDAGAVGPEFDNKLIDSTKVGVVEAMKDTGMINKQDKQETPDQVKPSISYKDLPPEGQVQAAAQAGIQISPEQALSKQQVAQKPLTNGPKR